MKTTMRALVIDNTLTYREHLALPRVPPNWALIRVHKAGICGTDLEIINGYKGYTGIIGHEFVGRVEQCDDSRLAGKRVVGEINVSCATCKWCGIGLDRHCSNRKVLGILNLNGCMADYCVLPVSNLHAIPDTITDNQAVMVEPLSAACEILEQLPLSGAERAVVLGDGRLGILCAWVLCTVLDDVTLSGRHTEKLQKANWGHLKTTTDPSRIRQGADVIVDATGSETGLGEAMKLCRPRGTIVLKSTMASPSNIDLTPVVVNELTIMGSRCGRFEHGLRMIQSYPTMRIESLICAEYPIERAAEAFDRARRSDTLKVLLKMV